MYCIWNENDTAIETEIAHWTADELVLKLELKLELKLKLEMNLKL